MLTFTDVPTELGIFTWYKQEAERFQGRGGRLEMRGPVRVERMEPRGRQTFEARSSI